MRLSNLMGSPGVTDTLHLELATADLVCCSKRDQYHRLFQGLSKIPRGCPASSCVDQALQGAEFS